MPALQDRPALETFCNSIDLPTDSKYNANACSTTICALNTETIELIMESKWKIQELTSLPDITSYEGINGVAALEGRIPSSKETRNHNVILGPCRVIFAIWHVLKDF